MVLFLITSETYNKWDTDVENREKEKKFNLMTKEEVKELIRDAAAFARLNKNTVLLEKIKVFEDRVAKGE